MTRPAPEGDARVARLVRLYPKDWRARYGDEFSDLLAEQPRSWVDTLDVASGAVMAHLAALGLSGTTIHRSDQPRRSLATLGCALALFMTIAISIWSHLSVAGRSGDPTVATHTAILIMTVAVAICVAAAGVGSIPIVCMGIKAATRRSCLRAPVLLMLAGAGVLTAGAIAFHAGWSGAGRQLWSQPSIGPGGPASYLWVSTLSVSAYWAHPTILSALPRSELAWMAIDSVALVASIVGAAKVIRRLDLSPRLVLFLTHTARAATAGLALFVSGTLIWLVDDGGGATRLFRAGAVDRLGLLVMTAALIVAVRSSYSLSATC